MGLEIRSSEKVGAGRRGEVVFAQSPLQIDLQEHQSGRGAFGGDQSIDDSLNLRRIAVERKGFDPDAEKVVGEIRISLGVDRVDRGDRLLRPSHRIQRMCFGKE